MKRIEIDALVQAHRGRAHPVASLHILRQNAIEPDDQVFLCEHARQLTIPDLLAWRVRCAPGFTGAVLRELARLAIEEPTTFKHEVLLAPRFTLTDEEWVELADLTRGKVPESLFDRILARTPETVSAPPNDFAPPVAEDLASFLDSELGEFELAPAPALPEGFTDANLAVEDILERARHPWSAEERAILLEWLTSRGLPRKKLIDIALAALRAGEHDPRLRSWLAGQLNTRSGWEAHGSDVVLALLDRNAFSALSSLVTLVWSDSSEAGKGEQRNGLLDAMMMAFGIAMVHLVREALGVAQPARAMVFLSALACLDLPTRLSRSIHDLLRCPGAEGEVRTLIEMNVRLVKHKKGRQATFDDLVAAIHCLADAAPEG